MNQFTFESILLTVESLRAPPSDHDRLVEWLGQSRVVGVSRAPDAGLELFIAADRLYPSTAGVRQHLVFDEWRTQNSVKFAANRIAFPVGEHFAPAVALIVEELFRKGVGKSPASAFKIVEPLIALMLSTRKTIDEQLLGLAGELWFLLQLLRKTSTQSQRASVFQSWKGFSRSARDFAFDGGVSVEVKSTQGSASCHKIRGIRQSDPARDSSGVATEDLFLLSVGFEVRGQPDDDCFTFAELQEWSLDALDPEWSGDGLSPLQELLAQNIERYGGGFGDSLSIESDGIEQTWFRVSFVRAYDLNDEAVRTIRAADVAEANHVAQHSIHFDLTLPDRLGEENPLSDAEAWMNSLL